MPKLCCHASVNRSRSLLGWWFRCLQDSSFIHAGAKGHWFLQANQVCFFLFGAIRTKRSCCLANGWQLSSLFPPLIISLSRISTPPSDRQQPPVTETASCICARISTCLGVSPYVHPCLRQNMLESACLLTVESSAHPSLCWGIEVKLEQIRFLLLAFNKLTQIISWIKFFLLFLLNANVSISSLWKHNIPWRLVRDEQCA